MEIDELRIKMEQLEEKVNDLEYTLSRMEKRLDNAHVECDISI